MRLVRFFVDLQPAALFRRALAPRCARVRGSLPPASSATFRCAFALSFTQILDHLLKLFAPSRHPASSFIGTKRTFNPHNSTRPPQPPAASF
jgi:hypothetical protein